MPELHQLLTSSAWSPRLPTRRRVKMVRTWDALSWKKGRISEIGMLMIRPNTLCALLENLKVRKYGKERHTCNNALSLFPSHFHPLDQRQHIKHMLGTKASYLFSLLRPTVLVYRAYAWNEVLCVSFSCSSFFQTNNAAFQRIKP